MKRLFVFLIAAIFLAACNNEKTESANTKGEEEKMAEDINYPYKGEYSHDFKMGDPNHSKMVLELYKMWEENRLDDMKTILADSVIIEFPDGNKFNNTVDSMVRMAKQFRSGLSAVKVAIETWMPIHVNDVNEDYVLVWGRDYSTDMSGKIDSSRTHAYFQIKNNKIRMWSEYQQKLTPGSPQ